MSCLKTLLTVLASIIVISCGTDSDPDEFSENWQQTGLEEMEIFDIEHAEIYLFAGTEEGAYKTSLNNLSNWQHIGLNSDTSRVTGFIVWNSTELLASVSYDTIRKEDKVLFKTTDGGETWQGWKLKLSEEEDYHSYIRHLDFNLEKPNTLFGTSGYVLRSTDSGQNWKRKYAFAVSEFLYISNIYSDQVWTGGWTPLGAPYLAKSDDGGDTWTNLTDNVSFNTEANINSATVHPEQEQTVLIGLNGSVGPANVIRKSEDGGETWQTVLEGYGIQVLKNSRVAPDRVYASGRSPEGQLFVALSTDYGNSWEILNYEESPGGIRTNDMTVANAPGSETLFLGTNKSVYSLTFNE